MNPSARSMQLLRKEHYQVALVEKWNSFAGVRQDLWGFGDVLAFRRQGEPVLIVQATVLSAISNRLKKARGLLLLELWLEAGHRFEVHGWALREGRWRVKRVAVELGQVEPVVPETVPRRKKKSRWCFRELF